MSRLQSRLALSFAACLLGASHALATDDDANDAQTAWVWYHDQTPSQITALIQQGYRVTNIEVDSASPALFTVAMVKNSGSYAKTFWWYYGQDSATIATELAQNSARLIDLEPYNLNGQVRFAAVMVKNTGADAKNWWWVASSNLNDVSTTLTQNGARLTKLDEVTIGANTYYAAIMIQNSGADAKSWWWYHGVDGSFVATQLGATGARLLDLARRSDGLFDVVLAQNDEGFHWWWYYGLDEAALNAEMAQTGSRALCVQKSNSFLGATYSAVLINDSNALTTTVGDILRTGTDGVSGLYLKEINGPVLASLEEQYVFEPASTLKTLVHAHAMKQVALGTVSLNQPILVDTGLTGSCPNGTQPVIESLQVVLTKMMQNSDNARTKAAVDFFGQANINATAVALGMTHSQINHVFGCGGPIPNQLTLVDGDALHEAVANGFLGAQKQTFHDIMLSSVPGYAGGLLGQVIDQEAAAIGVSNAMKAQFITLAEMAYKGGSYTIFPGPKEYRSVLSYVDLPFLAQFFGNTVVTHHQYVTGIFVHAASNGLTVDGVVNHAASELLRDEIHAALLTWKSNCVAFNASYGSGKAGTKGVPTLTSSQLPSLGATSSITLGNGKPGAAPLLFVGLNSSNQSFDGGKLLVQPQLILTLPVIPQNGTLSIAGTLPADPTLCGVTIYHQMMFADAGASGPYHTAQTAGLARTLGN